MKRKVMWFGIGAVAGGTVVGCVAWSLLLYSVERTADLYIERARRARKPMPWSPHNLVYADGDWVK